MAKKILFTEDEEALRKSLKEILEQEGYDVHEEMDGQGALDWVKENKPDLILLDLILPKKDGFEVMAELKENENTKNVPIIVLTNLESLADIEKALEAGATTYLVKANYNLEDVLQKVESILSE